MIPVDYWRRNACGNKADENEQTACDACLRFVEAVRFEHLVDERGQRVEEADIDAERGQDEPEGDVPFQDVEGFAERLLGDEVRS
jgi:hypothetical protein